MLSAYCRLHLRGCILIAHVSATHSQEMLSPRSRRRLQEQCTLAVAMAVVVVAAVAAVAAVAPQSKLVETALLLPREARSWTGICRW